MSSPLEAAYTQKILHTDFVLDIMVCPDLKQVIVYFSTPTVCQEFVMSMGSHGILSLLFM
jgi:hypothetical protein